MTGNRHRAVFLDRDGTINEDVGDLYLPEELRFITGAIEALRLLREKFLLFIITNQSGIGKGNFTEEQYLRFSRHFAGLLEQEGVVFSGVYHCPHANEDGCLCKKPSTHFMDRAAEEFSIDIASSYVIGDHPHDVEMGRRAGAGTVYLLTGHGQKHFSELTFSPDYIAADILDAARWIMKNEL